MKESDRESSKANTILKNEMGERKTAESALRESEERYRVLFEESPDGIIIAHKEDKKFLYVNPAICEMLGYNEEELKNKKLEELHPAENRDSVYAVYEQISRGIITLNERPLLKKDGTIIESDIRGIKVIIGGEDCNVGFFRDITERKRIEKALMESEAIAKTLINASTDIAILIDPDGAIVSINETGVKEIKGEIDGLVGEIYFDVLPPEVGRQRKFQIKKVMHSGKPIRFEYHRGKRWFEYSIYPVFDPDGNVIRIAVFAHDITGLKETEQMLKDREKALKAQARDLKEVNIALKVLLKKREEDKKEIEEKVLVNVKELVEPYLEKLKGCRLSDRQETFVSIIEGNLENIISPLARKLSSIHLNLTPSEIQVANLVKHGKTTKEIADSLNVAERTVCFHRENIRKRLGINKTKTNLRSFLSTLE